MVGQDMGAKQPSDREWRDVALGDLVDIKHGFAFKGDLPSTTNLMETYCLPREILLLAEDSRAESSNTIVAMLPGEFVLCEGDLLVTMTDLSKQADTLGYPALVPVSADDRRFLHNQRLGKVLIRRNCDVNSRFLYYVMCSSEYRHEVLASATGTTVKHTSPDRIRQFRFPSLRPYPNSASSPTSSARWTTRSS